MDKQCVFFDSIGVLEKYRPVIDSAPDDKEIREVIDSGWGMIIVAHRDDIGFLCKLAQDSKLGHLTRVRAIRDLLSKRPEEFPAWRGTLIAIRDGTDDDRAREIASNVLKRFSAAK